ncbi:MAG: UDP-2,4-diacetamido-2,4,6-trideoxy-beta-L-altropyranose hydrolase [Acetivibrio ethanolgignens]
MLYIRTDVNQTIATGHIMRCLSIADAAREKGESTTFLLADREAAGILEKRGYPYLVLDTRWDDMETELPVITKLMKEKNIEKLLIDSYQVTQRYLEELTKEVKTIYLDDLGRFPYPVNGIICYAAYWRKYYENRDFHDTRLYLGTKYTPLRKEFSDIRPRSIKEQIDNLLLLSGGSDPYYTLDSLLEGIKKERFRRIDVICGKYALDYESLCEKYRSFKNIFIHKAVADIKRYMEVADFAVTAGGSTMYELCSVGTPAASYSLADNQLANVKQFQRDGIIEYAGDVRNDTVTENISQLLEKYWKNRDLREEKSKKMQALVDGHGAGRIAEILING